MKRLWLFVLLALAACTGIETQEQKVAASCSVAATALSVLTVANDAGKLSEDVQARVVDAARLIAPTCTADAPPTLDDLKRQAFEQAILILQREAAGLGSTP